MMDLVVMILRNVTPERRFYEHENGLISCNLVNAIFNLCLSGSKPVKIEGMTQDYVLYEDTVEHYKYEIQYMIKSLPDQFKNENGWSLVCACEDKNGILWTPHWETIEKLFILGIVIGVVKHTKPKSYWPNLPFGFPYFKVIT
jgi:hypothetical protein